MLIRPHLGVLGSGGDLVDGATSARSTANRAQEQFVLWN